MAYQFQELHMMSPGVLRDPGLFAPWALPPANPAPGVGASYVAEVSFAVNSWDLKKEFRHSLTRMMSDMDSDLRIDAIKIIVWPDKSRVRCGRRKCSRQERELTERRAAAISGFMKGALNFDSFEIYNMADNPESLGEILDSPDPRIKRALEISGLADRDPKQGWQGAGRKASHAIVMIVAS